MTSPRETAAAIFERINRRRAESAAGAVPTAPNPRDPEPVPARDPEPAGKVHVRVDEVLFEPRNERPRQEADPASGAFARYGHGAGSAGMPGDRFPRSATMRLILKHPGLALGLGVPAAGLLLKSPASRRLLGMAVRVGTGPELQGLLRFSAGAIASGTPTTAAPPPRDRNPPTR